MVKGCGRERQFDFAHRSVDRYILRSAWKSGSAQDDALHGVEEDQKSFLTGELRSK